jgi:hypothetical protein
MQMKKTVIGVVLAVILLVACSKNQPDRTVLPGNPSIAGKWNVNTVNLYFYNATGLLDSSEIGYPVADLEYPLYFQFNGDSSWLESLVVNLDTTVVAKGIYSYTSNNSFNLIYPDASPSRKDEPCNIVSLTNDSFIFSKQLPTVFNGTDPGYIKYVFRLSK